MQSTLQTLSLPDMPEFPVEEPEEGVRSRLWTHADYYRAAELGLFQPQERLELIRGEVFKKMSPQNIPHATALAQALHILTTAFGVGYHLRPQLPLRLAPDTELEPDLLVLPGSPRDYREHPTAADVDLLVEISDTTLRYDRNTKGPLYAEAGIQEYWIIALKTRTLEVYREPLSLPESVPPFGYKSRTLYTEEDTVSPLGAPHAILRVADLLPLPETLSAQQP